MVSATPSRWPLLPWAEPGGQGRSDGRLAAPYQDAAGATALAGQAEAVVMENAGKMEPLAREKKKYTWFKYLFNDV